MSIMDYFPRGMTPRKQQTQILEEVELNWKTASVFSITAPTGTGKSAICVTIANWAADQYRMGSNILMPTNILVEQLKERHPDVPTLFKRDHYEDEELYAEARHTAIKSKVRAMNYHLYMAHRMYSPIMICDESHKLLDVLDGMGDVRIWKHEYPFPTGMTKVAEVIEWIQARQAVKFDARLDKALKAIINIRDNSIVVYEKAMHRSKLQDVLSVKPSTTRFIPPFLWPRNSVKKIILISATTGRTDVRELGLDGRHLCEITVDSPIPADRRRIYYSPVCNMAQQYVALAIKEVAAEINRLLFKHKDKGLIHIPYSTAKLLREHLKHPRIMYHERDNKADQLAKFRASSEPLVLVASGLYEGVDLPYDEARWQVIAKVPFANLGDPRIKAKLEVNDGWYSWEAIKKIMQASGRIVRAPDDFGVTYIFDTAFERLWREDNKREQRLFQKYFLDALIMKE